MATSGAADWPLRGRDAELRAVVDALDHTGGVLLAGPAGVGKTRLARQALATRRAGARVRLLRATRSAQGIPLGAFAPALGAVLAGGDGDAGVLGRAHAALRADPRLVLGVDDAHLLDDVSATLLHQLAEDRAMRLVVTVRSGEPATDAVTALWRDGLLQRIDITELTDTGTAAVLEAALDGPVETASAERLYRVTGGNVLWLRHLVAGEVDSGRLRADEGLWRWVGQPDLSPALSALIDARIGELANGVRPVVELLALGEPLDAALLETLCGPAALEEALTRGLVQSLMDGGRWQARLAHPLYGEVVRARIDELRARRLRGTLAAGLVAGGSRNLLRRAALALDSDLPDDPELLVAAAEQATRLTDVDLAIRLLDRACAAGAGFDAHLALAFGLTFVVRPEQAEPVLARASALAGDDAQLARTAFARAVNLGFVLADVEAAEAVLVEAERRVSSGAALQGMRAVFEACRGRLAAAEELAAAVLASPDPPPQAVAACGSAMTLAAGLAGRADELAASSERAIAAALHAPETAMVGGNIAFLEIFGLALAGRPDQVRRRADQAGAGLGGRFTSIALPTFNGIHGWAVGRATAAARQLREALAWHPGHGAGYTTWLESLLGQTLGASGDAEGARAAVARGEANRHPLALFVEPLLELARAWAAAAEGSDTLAAASARDAAALAAGSGQWAVEVLARHAAVGFGDPDQAGRLRELAAFVHGPRAQLAADHAEALAKRDIAGLLEVAERFETAGLLQAAAEAAAQAADQLHRRGAHVGAAEAAARAASIAHDCGLRTPALVAAEQPSLLSARQREIATLAAHLTNAQIARRLGVSVRTVEGHIYHSCQRLGLANRAELAAHLARTDRVLPPPLS